MTARRLLHLRAVLAAAALTAGARAAVAQGTAAPPAAPAAELALPVIAPGDSAPVPAVERLLAASDAERAYNQAVALSVAAQTRANPALAEQADVLRAFVARHASFAAIRADLIRVYRETFTAREVAELTQSTARTSGGAWAPSCRSPRPGPTSCSRRACRPTCPSWWSSCRRGCASARAGRRRAAADAHGLTRPA
jgi:hypothetical protein